MRHLLLYLIFSVSFYSSYSQNTGIGVGTTNPHPSAALEISDTSRGILIPRMTMSQRLAIQNPAEGLMVYQSDSTYGNWNFAHGEWRQIQLSSNLVQDSSKPRVLHDGFTITNGIFSPPNGSIWKVESMNLINDAYIYTINVPFWGCTCGPCGGPSNVNHCRYLYTGGPLPALKIGSVVVNVSPPQSEFYVGNYGTYGNYQDCPPSCATSDYIYQFSVTSSVFSGISLPIWVKPSETIELVQGIMLSISEYR